MMTTNHCIVSGISKRRVLLLERRPPAGGTIINIDSASPAKPRGTKFQCIFSWLCDNDYHGFHFHAPVN